MRRPIVLNVLFTVALTMLTGCEEGPLNQPVQLPEASWGSEDDVEYFSRSLDDTRILNESLESSDVGEPSARIEEDQPSNSKVNSIFNALKNGAASAMEQSTSDGQ